MVAFRAADASAVDAFHGAGINAGGTDEGAPGPDRATETAITAPIFAIPTATRFTPSLEAMSWFDPTHAKVAYRHGHVRCSPH